MIASRFYANLLVKRISDAFEVYWLKRNFELECLFLAGEVIVEPTQGNMGTYGNLAHRGAMIALLNEQIMGSLQDS